MLPPQKKKNKKSQSNVIEKKKLIIKAKKCVCTYTRHFCPLRKNSSSLSFFSIVERKHFGGLGKKISRPHYLFSFLSTQPNTLQKSFPSYFFFKIFHPPYFTSKQKHPNDKFEMTFLFYFIKFIQFLAHFWVFLHFLILFMNLIILFSYFLAFFPTFSAKSSQFQLNKLFPNKP